ncbi:hypothetical protein ACFP3Q_00615 [Nocardioides sp. GCM10027113]|uniref:hypothetical protein n=1 Tax=unclassified Nocardioides TaxID=2615069 RepID=UPI00361A2CD1
MSTNQPTGPNGPEYLEQGGGEPLAREPRTPRGGKRRALVAGGVVGALALVGGGAWALSWWSTTGSQPAEALPAGTLGYAGVDLDPSGSQKVEAIRMLNKFPAFKEELGLDADDDIRQRLFEDGLTDACEDLDYAADVEPWLGHRMAVAAVELGEGKPEPAMVLQVSDVDAAEDGLAALRDCTGDTDSPGWVVEGEWAVVAETDDLAQEVVDARADGTLADDEDFQRWTEAAGDPGVITMYAAPEAGRHLLDGMSGLMGLGAYGGMPGVVGSGEDLFDPELSEPGLPDSEVPEELRTLLEDFSGMAVSVRFDDGALEVEAAVDAAMSEGFYAEEGADVVTTLPSDTVVAVGAGLADGWLQTWLDQFAAGAGGGMSVDDLLAMAEAETGLALPEDIETLFGDSAAFALGGDFDPEAFFASSDGSDIPFGFKVQGDPPAVEGVLGKLQTAIAAEGGPEIASESEGDTIAFGFNADYVSSLAGDGGLGDTDTFQNVVREADRAVAIFFLDFDGSDNWLAELASGDPEAQENLEPLEGLGISGWIDGDTAHSMLRVTTD